MNIYLETKKENKSNYTLEEITNIIENNKGLEEIIISNGINKYPCLVVQLNNDLACINYFPKEEDKMNLTSLGNYDKEVEFLAGGEKWTAPCNCVVKNADAILCIKEFINNDSKLPTCIKWHNIVGE